jgi:hypothetical protein
MEGVYLMSKASVKSILDTNKDFWNQAVSDATAKIVQAKQKIKELERAREVFKRNAAENVPIPGVSDAATQN